MTRKTRVRKQLQKIKRRKNDDRTNARKLDQEGHFVEWDIDRNVPADHSEGYFGRYDFDEQAPEEVLAGLDPLERFIAEASTSDPSV